MRGGEPMNLPVLLQQRMFRRVHGQIVYVVGKINIQTLEELMETPVELVRPNMISKEVAELLETAIEGGAFDQLFREYWQSKDLNTWSERLLDRAEAIAGQDLGDYWCRSFFVGTPCAAARKKLAVTMAEAMR